MAFADPSMVLTLFVKALGGSNLLAGLPPTLARARSLAPQLLVDHRLQRRKRLMPSIWAPELLCFGAFLLIGSTTSLLGAARPEAVPGAVPGLVLSDAPGGRHLRWRAPDRPRRRATRPVPHRCGPGMDVTGSHTLDPGPASPERNL